MKKVLLSICTVLITTTIFGQIKVAEMPNQMKVNYTNNVVANTPVSAAAVVPFFTDDFSDPNNWEAHDLLNGGLQNWVITTNAPTGAFSAPMGAIASTTAANGFGLYDSDAMNNNYTTPQDAVLTYKGTVDCSAYQYVNINFESYHRRFHDSVFVEISTDSVSWDRYEVHANLGVTDASDNPELVSINISASAGNQAAVYFRFHYEGEWDYAWMVDDVSFSETPDNAISFKEETFGGWWIGYNATGDFGTDYTFYPMSQATANPYRFEGVIANIGVQTQNNVTMHVSVDDGVNAPYTFASSPLTLASSQQDTVATTANFTPTEMGYHQISYWASSDNVPTTDTVGRGTIVTDTVYGVDFDWDTDGANAGGGYYLGRSCGGQVLSNAFDIYTDATVTSISFHVNDKSVVGAQLKAELYETDPTQTLANSPPVWYEESEDYVLTAADIDSWVTLRLKSPILVSANTTWLAAVHGEQGFVGDTSLISSNSNPNSVSYLQDNCGTGSWHSISNAMLIRMNFGLETTAVEDHKMQGVLEVYPNPSKGLFTLELTDIGATNNALSITNVLGQTVYAESFSVQGSVRKELDLSSLEKGVYLLRIENKSSSITQQIVIE